MKYRNYDITIMVTQRCNSKCSMCDLHKTPSKVDEEISIKVLEKIPYSKYIQITGGEPFVRRDIEDVVKVLLKKSKRLMINTNGYYTEKVVALSKKYPSIAVRVSLDGHKNVHNDIRGIEIYDRALNTVKELKRIGIRDLGISFTLQESNYFELLPMYKMAVDMGVDFGVAVIHNSFFFNKQDNTINDVDLLVSSMRELVKEQLKSKRIFDWARAYYNDMSICYMNQQHIPIHCDVGISSFMVDVEGRVLPCTMSPEPWVMGDLKSDLWDEIMCSKQALNIINMCKKCSCDCWCASNMYSAIKKNIWIPFIWLVKNKYKMMINE